MLASSEEARLVRSLTPHFAPDAPAVVGERLRSLLVHEFDIDRGAKFYKMAAELSPTLLVAGFEPAWVTQYVDEWQRDNEYHAALHDEGAIWLSAVFPRLTEDAMRALVLLIRKGALSGDELLQSGLAKEAPSSLLPYHVARRPDGPALITANLGLMTLPELKEICGSLGTRKGGRKADVIERLLGAGAAPLLKVRPELERPVYVCALTAHGVSLARKLIDRANQIAELWAMSEAAYIQEVRNLRDMGRDGCRRVELLSGNENCPLCQSRKKKYPIAEAPELPRHPGCRCTWLPVL